MNRSAGLRPGPNLAASPNPPGRTPALQRAFSLIEIMVAVALLTVIIIGLVAMFGQTQKAFRAGLTQTDVLEAGRSLSDMFFREAQEMRPSRGDRVVNFFADTNSPLDPLLQVLPGNTANPQYRTNVLEDVFFLTLKNRQWQGIGYRVDAPNGLFGTLYRWSTNPAPDDLRSAFINFSRTKSDLASTNNSRMADGVVHFRVRAYDTNGIWITTNLLNVQMLVEPGGTNISAFYQLRPQHYETAYQFERAAIPAWLDVEIGVLEPRTLERARSIPDLTAQRAFLERQAGTVQIFHQRLPLPNVDPSAYPASPP